MATRRTKASPDQLGLFGIASPDTSPDKRADNGPDTRSPGLASVYEAAGAIASALPDTVRFGTSSWSFPGWAGSVYARKRSVNDLARDGLEEYARHPLLRTVGIDRGYYAPIPENDLARYASQLPDGYLACAKAPERLTAPVSLGHGRGASGEPNPDFLSPDFFEDTVAGPFDRAFRSHTGPVILEFPPLPPAHRMDPLRFAEALDRFLETRPSWPPVAVELRDRALLTSVYRDVLARHGAGHVYNYWTAMPMPGAQTAVVPVEAMPFVMVRLLLKPGTRYEAQKEAFAPFDRVQAADETMRAQVVALLMAAVKGRLPAYVLVNNKAEGSSPGTVWALAEQFARELARG